ncbi:MAG: hypothetical protein EAZ81_02595 [Verrucomicrobia bacterium]|nr:MAG: hypothetical protein EAZ81_02595 [Verrucomicrobiota bacterium]
MKRSLIFILTLPFSSFAFAQNQASPEDRLREQLRATALQLRTAETDKVNAVALHESSVRKIAELEKKLSALEKTNSSLTQELTQQRAASEKTIASLHNKIADRDQRLKEFSEALDSWKKGYQKSTTLIHQLRTELESHRSNIVELKNTIEDRERKNIELFNISIEVLDRYQKFALGKSLAAREPFIGNTRVKVENLVQDYHQKIINQRLHAEKKP